MHHIHGFGRSYIGPDIKQDSSYMQVTCEGGCCQLTAALATAEPAQENMYIQSMYGPHGRPNAG